MNGASKSHMNNGIQQSCMCKVFVLSASSHQGKTTTLNRLSAYLNIQPGWQQIDGPNPPLTGGTDAQYVFEHNDGKRVGISTAGDGAWQITNGFQYFAQHKCDTCFIASKSWGSSVQQIEVECAALHVIPQYQFLLGEYSVRARTQVQLDIVAQLYGMI